ncbi:MAG: N-acetylneuraminate synthase family protein, partial [Bacteroidota bacterium]
ERYPNCRVGLSEHTGKVATGIAARALGAELLEFHVVFDRRMFGPDASSSLTIDEVRELVNAVRFLERSFATPIDKNDLHPYTELKRVFGKTLTVSRDLPIGHQLTFDDLEAAKPAGQGIAADTFRSVIGRTLNKAKTQYDFLQAEDLD